MKNFLKLELIVEDSQSLYNIFPKKKKKCTIRNKVQVSHQMGLLVTSQNKLPSWSRAYVFAHSIQISMPKASRSLIVTETTLSTKMRLYSLEIKSTFSSNNIIVSARGFLVDIHQQSDQASPWKYIFLVLLIANTTFHHRTKTGHCY